MLTTIIVASSFVSVPVGETAYGYIETNPIGVHTALAAKKETRGPTKGVEALVRAYFEDIPVMINVAKCESGFTHTLGDGSVIKGKVDSADTGVMQINLRFHEVRAQAMGLDVHKFGDNLAYARKLYEERGTQPWNASSACWQKTLASTH